MLRYSPLILMFGLGVCHAAVIPNSVNDLLASQEINAVPQGAIGIQQDDLESAATTYSGRGLFGGGYGGYGRYGYPGYHDHHYDDHHHHHDDYHHHHHDDYHHHHGHYDHYHDPHHHGPYYGDYGHGYGHGHYHHHHDTIGFGIPGLFDIHLGK